MEPDRFLIATAQISLAISGFAGIVAAYRSDSVHEWSVVERFWLQLLLFNSILPFSLSLGGIFYLATGPHAFNGWRVLSGFAAACLAPYGVMIVMRLRRLPPGALRSAGGGSVSSTSMISLLVAVCLLQIWNAAIGSEFWPFYAAIMALIFGAVFQFARLVLKSHRHQTGERPSDISEEG